MNKEQILKKCIEKAIKRGWKPFILKLQDMNDEFIKVSVRTGLYADILFDHSFAKAFWGEDKVCDYCGGDNLEESDYEGLFECGDCDCSPSYTQPKWHYYGKSMFLAPDRLEYMKQFINGGKDERD